jgi:hypothetical protein
MWITLVGWVYWNVTAPQHQDEPARQAEIDEQFASRYGLSGGVAAKELVVDPSPIAYALLGIVPPLGALGSWFAGLWIRAVFRKVPNS